MKNLKIKVGSFDYKVWAISMLSAIVLSLWCLLLSAKEPPKKYHLEFDDAQLNQLMYIIDNSSAPHDVVKQCWGNIQAQLKPQVDLPKTDSVTSKKK